MSDKQYHSGYEDLFDYLNHNHGLNMLQSEMSDLIHFVHKFHPQPQSAVWVKATTRVPLDENLYHLNYGTSKTKMKTTGFYDGKKWHRQDGAVLDWHPNLEWLDESATTSNKDEAVAFAEWAGWEWRRVEGKNMWENQETLEVIKTKELYERYERERGAIGKE